MLNLSPTTVWTMFTRCFLSSFTVSRISTVCSFSWLRRSSVISRAINVPVLPTPALQKKRDYGWYNTTSYHHITSHNTIPYTIPYTILPHTTPHNTTPNQHHITLHHTTQHHTHNTTHNTAQHHTAQHHTKSTPHNNTPHNTTPYQISTTPQPTD